MKIVIAMAGLGLRSQGAVPKPLVMVAHRPMISWAMDNLVHMEGVSELVLVLLASHERQFGLAARLRTIQHPLLDWSRVRIVLQESAPSGQLTSVLEARSWLDTDQPVLIASCDTVVVSDLGSDISSRGAACRGIISVADKPGEQWSFAKVEPGTRRVVDVAEKVRISDYASTGMYFFSSGREFLDASDRAIAGREQPGGEHYVIPVYREYIRDGRRIEISTPAREMWDLGTPTARAEFLARGHQLHSIA